VRFEWDENKNAANRKKHGVSFETARLVFDDIHCLFVLDRVVDGEERWHAIGAVHNIAMVLTVVHTHTGDGVEEFVRLISARAATKQEQEDYAKSM
jgi:uncharacterized protein